MYIVYGKDIKILICFLFHVVFNSQGHIAMGSLQVEEPVYSCWSIFHPVNPQASPSNYQLSNMKCPGQDSNQRPQSLRAGTLTSIPPSPLQDSDTSLQSLLYFGPSGKSLLKMIVLFYYHNQDLLTLENKILSPTT